MALSSLPQYFLCFSTVGRKLSYTIRTKLFGSTITQDVAFFDGNSSGSLSSRLLSDVYWMVGPIQTMLGRLISNTMLLVGGTALCFYTSWRLSVLAFTTVGPIIYLTQLYASWSQALNRKIHAAIGIANGYATEAFSNVRTVKSFVTEEHEIRKFTELAYDVRSAG